MEEIFDQMNNEVDKNTVDKQCAEIIKKNLLIENENLIANCLSTQLLHDVQKSRCLDLEADMSKVHNESKHVSKLEREYLNLQLKYQHLQESFDNKNSQTSQEAPDFNSFFKIKNLEHQIQEKDNVIRDLKVLVTNVNDRSYEPYNDKDVTALIKQNDGVRIELENVKQYYKEFCTCQKIKTALQCLHQKPIIVLYLLRATNKYLWLRTQLTDYGFHFDKIPMYCDSKAAMAISCNPVQQSHTKHIDVRYHFMKEQVEKGIVELFFVRTEYQLADLFTKALSEDRFKYLVRRLGMRCLTPDELEVQQYEICMIHQHQFVNNLDLSLILIVNNF
ncbi:retrovirus-related pol polyprotein from transposon TNT 1-94 [Tanacetum coccineum]